MLRVTTYPYPCHTPPPKGTDSPLGVPGNQNLPADIWKVFACETWWPIGAKASRGEIVAASALASVKKPGVTGSDQAGKGCS